MEKRPLTNSNTPSTSFKDIPIKLARESKSNNISAVNLPSLHKSRTQVTFEGKERKPQPLSKSKNPSFHSFATRSGNFLFPEEKAKKKTPGKISSMSSNSSILEHIHTPPLKFRQTLKTLIHNFGRDSYNAFFRQPVFLNTLLIDGKIDKSSISTIIPFIMAERMYEFINNMTTEMSIHSSLSACHSVQEVENILPKIIKFNKVLIWEKPLGSDFLISQTLREIVPINRSIVGYCAQKKKKVITDDPAMCSGFDIDYDLPILRGTVSMALLPVISDFGDLVAVIHFIDLLDNLGNPIPISQYVKHLLKATRDLIKIQIYNYETNSPKLTIDLVYVLQMSNCETFEIIIQKMLDFLKKYFDCEGADIFEYDFNRRRLIRLVDNVEFTEARAGLSYLPLIKDEPIFVAQSLQMGFARSKIDRLFTNNSALTNYYKINDIKYVFTLRSKWMLPSFLTEDLMKLNDISKILCFCIQNAKLYRTQKTEIDGLVRNNELVKVLGKALTSYIDHASEKWNIFRNAVKEVFGAENCFVCSFDGIQMHFHPTEITCKFDDCIAGQAFNYQELTEYKRKEGEDFPELYLKLGIEELNRSVAFHFFDDGKIKGSIEMINPTSEIIDQEGQNILGIICSMIHPF
ncbi:hypothetical protein TRFO_14373 [Tritrichomonas foetus]|uniref:GAF domain-containing protein n=1 Tax=Tritrichomonas foetus TaxID=1144522 RepID=A0A1J4KV41_9EUKA|nr:hypothetical protein TRFO_14373 [Tritrichomonas foetus]|eukprot:OHT15185.1 hypothetical protein TRFO_14373 [Tritrichomonas foetus]